MSKAQISEKIQKLDAEHLSYLLKKVKLYRDLSKQLWKRWKDQYFRNVNNEKLFLVEHVENISQDIAWEQAQSVYKKCFWIEVKQEQVNFVINNVLKGGIKVYCDDALVDLSFRKIEGRVQ